MKYYKWILILLLTLTLVACGGNQDDNGNEDDLTPPLTDTLLINNGTTDYTVVVPNNHSNEIAFALSEFRYFFKEASGISIEFITDESLTFNEESKYLSIGNTSLLTGSGVSIDFNELGEDGFKVVTKGNTVLMAGGSDNGSLYAAYEFLERTFNLNVFSKDEFYIDEVSNDLFLSKFNLKEIPLFPKRSVGLYTFTEDAVFRKRMRQQFYSDGWILWSHSHFTILPPSIYKATNPSWYSSDGSQLNLTNDEMREEFTRVVIELVKNNPTHNNIMLGMEDVNTFGDSPEELAAINKYTEAGVLVRFTNLVAEAVENYINEHEPGRVFYVSTFAYFKSENPPVTLNSSGNYEAVDPSVIPRDNVQIMIAPIYAANSKDFHDEINRDVKRIYEGWNAIASGKITTWIYNKYFNQYFIPFHNFSTLKDNYKILADMGVQFVYHQGNKETPAGGLQDLMSYVQAKLMWSLDHNLDDLALEFSRGFYYEAGDTFMEYFDLIRMSFNIWQELYDLEAYNSGSNSQLIYSPNLWTRDLLDQFDNLFEKMMDEIDHYRLSNPDLYDTLKLRIDKERLTVEYLYLQFYFHQFSYEEALLKINNFEENTSKLGIRVWREQYFSIQTDREIASLINIWRLELNKK